VSILPGIYASQITGHLSTLAYDSIATVTVGAGGSSSITFSSIPSTYKHLQIRAYIPTGNYFNMRFNGDTTTTNYREHYLSGDGSTVYAGTNANNLFFPGAGGWSTPYVGILDILDYTNTNKYKTQKLLEGYDPNGTGAELNFRSGLWMSTSAISSIVLSRTGASVGQYSSFALYGIRG
jgi:hypothetical protein